MKVYKFGGASLATASGVRNVAQIVAGCMRSEGLVVVVSAMSKMTNALEVALDHALRSPEDLVGDLRSIRSFHLEVAQELLGPEDAGIAQVESLLDNLELLLTHLPCRDYDSLYDRIIPHGELLSSRIVQRFLARTVGPCVWVDARRALRTDSVHRSATVNWDLSQAMAREVFPDVPQALYVTQGFIGSTPQGLTTTLGREGSDYTATLLAAFLGADEVTIWKDVPGFLTADPKLFPSAEPLAELDYREAIELSYNGAKIVHPKAIKPVQNAGIPLLVRSFVAPDLPGTRIASLEARGGGIPQPRIALREGQCLLSISPRDLSFALEEHLGAVFSLLQAHGVRVRLVQNTAISLNLCVDDDRIRLPRALEALGGQFAVAYNRELLLLTIRHYRPELTQILDGHPGVLLRQTTRATQQYLLRGEDWRGGLYEAMRDALSRMRCQAASLR